MEISFRWILADIIPEHRDADIAFVECAFIALSIFNRYILFTRRWSRLTEVVALYVKSRSAGDGTEMTGGGLDVTSL